ncbi:MAG: phospholipase A [Gammaproteobacteria bacterium]|nr:phospholipase A [Gammaproteobacteria bacterium]
MRQQITSWYPILFLSLCCTVTATQAQPAPNSKQHINDQTTISHETPLSKTPLDERLISEQQTQWNKFVITPHKPNYVLPIAYDSKRNEQIESDDNLEIKFQFSLRVPLVQGLLGENSFISLGYTQVSYWQAYNSDASAAFRETNFEPELMLTFFNNTRIMNLTNRLITVGVVHQSNGQSSLTSRSWNRIYVNFILEKQNLYLSIKPWYRFPEDKKQNPLDSAGDDNPNIEKYLGYGELSGIYKFRKQTYGFMLRNNLRTSDSKGAIQFDWTFPLHGRLNGYIQYFNGYGESLIDYNRYTNRLAVGIMFTNWL